MLVTLSFLAALLVGAALWLIQPLAGARKVAGVPIADPSRLEACVRRLVAEFSPRDFGHPENLARAAEWIAGEFRAHGAEVSEQVFAIQEVSYRNVVASYGPPTAAVVVVGAHCDTDGELPGADDNASGVAGVLELGRLLSGVKLSMRVELVAYALEEMPVFGTGWMGSDVHARSVVESGRAVRGMLCLEMIGCFTDEARSQRFPFPLLRLFYPGRGNFVAVVGNVGGVALVRRVKRSMRSAGALPVYSINAPALVPGVDLSDHSSYWREGLPAVMITDTAFYRNDRYHTADDTPETLDYERMAKVVDGVFGAVLDLARANNFVDRLARPPRPGD